MKNGIITNEFGTKFYYKDDKLHREDGPAVVHTDGNFSYWIDDKKHREDGPAVIYSNGDIEYRIEGKLHREDGPAVIYANGGVEYWIEGKLHREDEPAAIYSSGTVEYYVEGELHREDGPAVIYPNGTLEYWIDGKFIDSYYADFGCFYPKSRKGALKRLNEKERPYSRELYLADINEKWPVEKINRRMRMGYYISYAAIILCSIFYGAIYLSGGDVLMVGEYSVFLGAIVAFFSIIMFLFMGLCGFMNWAKMYLWIGLGSASFMCMTLILAVTAPIILPALLIRQLNEKT